MKIELYNEKWLQEKGKNTPISSAIIDKPSSDLDHIVFQPHPDTSYPSTREMHQNSGTSPDNVESKSSIRPAPIKDDIAPFPCNLRDNIIKNIDRLFFIAYTPSGTMTKRWHLVQADLKATAPTLLPDVLGCLYYCTFLAVPIFKGLGN